MMNGNLSECVTSKNASPVRTTLRLSVPNDSVNSSVLPALSHTWVLSGSSRYLDSEDRVACFSSLLFGDTRARAGDSRREANRQTTMVARRKRHMPTRAGLLDLRGRRACDC